MGRKHAGKDGSERRQTLPADEDESGARGHALRDFITNPATEILIADVLMRAAGRVIRTSVEKRMLRRSLSRRQARKLVEQRSFAGALASYAAARIATRSVPGALLVGTGLLARTLYETGRERRAARARTEGDANAAEAAEEK